MSTTSDSSDSDEPDFDPVYDRVTGENPGGSKAINCGVSQEQTSEDNLIKLIKESVENPASIPQNIKVVGPGAQIFPGIHIHRPRDTQPQADDFLENIEETKRLENIEETKRLEKIVEGIRDYYHTVREGLI